MSLRVILARLHSNSDLECRVQKTSDYGVEVSPLIQELRNQLGLWKQSLPSFLGWSTQPTGGETSLPAMRLKYLYWFARFLLFKPLVLYVLCHAGYSFPLSSWTFFQEGVQAGLTLVKVSLLEKIEWDIIIGNR